VCDPAGGTLEVLPAESFSGNAIRFEEELTCGADGTVTGRVERVLPAYGLYRLKELFGTLPEAQVRGWFARQANELFPGARVLARALPRREEAGVPLTITFEFQAEGAIRARGDGKLELRGVVPPSDLKERYAAYRTRQLDLLLHDVWAGGGARRDSIRVHLGPYVCPRLPKSVAIKNQFGQFSLSWIREGPERIKVQRLVLLRSSRVRTSDYPAFRRFLEEIDRVESAPLLLEKRE
jgi:hypothetical protein